MQTTKPQPMPCPAYRFTFGPQVPLEDAHAVLFFAIDAMGLVFDPDQLGHGVRYRVDQSAGAIDIDGSTDAGPALVCAFKALLAWHFGDGVFTAEKLAAAAVAAQN